MLQRGVSLGSCGVNSIRLRPALTIDERHFNIMYETAEKTLKSMI